MDEFQYALMTPAQLALARAPNDDSGAETADRYEWQFAMAAADGFAHLLYAITEGSSRDTTSDFQIVCEWHEDWLIIRDGEVELVSAKHREPSVQTLTTVHKIVSECGLAHLHERWHALGETPACRIVTTGGLAAGPPKSFLRDCQALADQKRRDGEACETAAVAATLERVRKSIVASNVDTRGRWEGKGGSAEALKLEQQRAEVARSLSSLTVEEAKPNREIVRFSAPLMYAQPALNELKYTMSAVVAWEAVLMLFRARMRSVGPLSAGALPHVLGSAQRTHSEFVDANGRSLAERTVSLSDIKIALDSAARMPTGYLQVRPPPSFTRLAMKMSTGGCTGNSIERAEHLRRDYLNYWRERRSVDVTASAAKERFERRLLRLNDEAAPLTSEPGVRWKLLQNELGALHSTEFPPGMDSELALGGICDLTNRCRVWFSDRFDVNLAIAALKRQSRDEDDS